MTAVLLILLLVLAENGAKATDVGIKDALVERTGFDNVAELAEELGVEEFRSIFSRVLSGEISINTDEIKELISEKIRKLLDEVKTDALKMALPVFFSAIAGILLTRKSGNLKGVMLMCRVAAGVAMAEVYLDIRSSAGVLIGNIGKTAQTVSPVLISLLSVTGAATTASLLSPVATFCAAGGVSLLQTVGLLLTDAGAATAFCGNLSENFRLKKLFELIRSFVVWTTGTVVAGFTAMLAIQGLTGNSADTAAMKGMQHTAESLIPIIGSNISDSMGSILSGVAMIKNAMGISCILLVGMICIRPIAMIVVYMAILKIIAAVFEPAADPCIIDTSSQFGDIIKMLAVLCVGGGMMVVLLVGAVIAAAGNMLS